MTTLCAYIDGIGLLGPGLNNWPAARAILAGEQPYLNQQTVLPAPAMLPPAERRRCGPIVKISLAVGYEAGTGCDLTGLPTVFSASGGDGNNCHELCAMLASDDRQISPTRFHNSVHNAAAGYWSIAAGATATSSVLCAYDASFGAGLLEAMTQTSVDQTRTLLIACDTAYPDPLRKARPIPDEFGVAVLLSPTQTAASLARIGVSLGSEKADRLADAALEQVRAAIPAARSLPLLRLIARRASGRAVIDYLDGCSIAIEVESCGR